LLVTLPGARATVAVPDPLIVATLLAEELQVAEDVTFAVVLSVYVAVAVNWTALLLAPNASAAFANPNGNVGLLGVTVISCTPSTVSTNGADTGAPGTVAVMFVVPPLALSTPVASPVLLLIAATPVLLDAKVAATGPELPSL
jgi:hypothetical protein